MNHVFCVLFLDSVVDCYLQAMWNRHISLLITHQLLKTQFFLLLYSAVQAYVSFPCGSGVFFQSFDELSVCVMDTIEGIVRSTGSLLQVNDE